MASDCVVSGILCLNQWTLEHVWVPQLWYMSLPHPVLLSRWNSDHCDPFFFHSVPQLSVKCTDQKGLKHPDTPEYKLSLHLDSDSKLPVWSALQLGIGLPFHSHCQERHSKCKLFFYPSSGGRGVGNINRILIIF